MLGKPTEKSQEAMFNRFTTIPPHEDQGGTDHGIPAGGTTGQVLGKKSDTDYDVEWKDAGASDEPELLVSQRENFARLVYAGPLDPNDSFIPKIISAEYDQENEEYVIDYEIESKLSAGSEGRFNFLLEVDGCGEVEGYNATQSQTIGDADLYASLHNHIISNDGAAFNIWPDRDVTGPGKFIGKIVIQSESAAFTSGASFSKFISYSDQLATSFYVDDNLDYTKREINMGYGKTLPMVVNGVVPEPASLAFVSRLSSTQTLGEKLDFRIGTGDATIRLTNNTGGTIPVTTENLCIMCDSPSFTITSDSEKVNAGIGTFVFLDNGDITGNEGPFRYIVELEIVFQDFADGDTVELTIGGTANILDNKQYHYKMLGTFPE